VLMLYVTLLRVHAEESLLVLRGLGVQTSSIGRTVLSSRSTRFIPTDKIRQVLINEAMWGFRARHCLVIIVDGEEDMVVVFPGLLPSMEIVLTVWHGIRGCLREKQGHGKGRS
jgi:phosphatidylinositol glycan class H protein